MQRSNSPEMRITSRRGNHPERRAAATVELAVVLPLLLLLFAGSIDFARIYSDVQLVTEYARAGAVFAADPDLADRSGHETVEALIASSAIKLSPKPQVSVVYGTDERSQKYVQVTVRHSFNLMTSILRSTPMSVSHTSRARLRPAAL